MQHISTTPCGRRAVTPAQLRRDQALRQPHAGLSADKWQLFSALKTARRRFGLNDRNLTVLSALLSFFPDRDLSGCSALVVWPSNAVLSERANGIPESSLRRHLQRLIEAGLIARQDSPNGKRYARQGPCPAVFGFSLAPLLSRSAEIEAAAAEETLMLADLRATRETVILLLRDTEKTLNALNAPLPDAIIEMRRDLRRTLPLTALKQLERLAARLCQDALLQLESATGVPVSFTKSEEMSASDSQNERHNKDSTTDLYDSLTTVKLIRPENVCEDQNITLNEVHRACPDILPYTRSGLHEWSDLVAAAHFAFPMMGIASATWSAAERTLGPVLAALSVAVILQKIEQIPNPGGYLTRLMQNGTSARRLLNSLSHPTRKVDSCQLFKARHREPEFS